MNVKEIKETVLNYLITHEKDGWQFFDGDVVSKELKIPVTFIMNVIDEFEANDFIQRSAMAQHKNQITLKLAAFEYHNSLKPDNNTIKPNQDTMVIFISHSSHDKNLAQAVVNLLQKAFHLHSDSIRCTSLSGFKLPTGVDTNNQLKEEIFTSKIFIGIITQNSIQSIYVLFELGARWGTKKPLFPLVCDPLGAGILKNPLNGINALIATDEADLDKFIEDVGNQLNIPPDRPSSYRAEIKMLHTLAFGKGSDHIDTSK